MQDRFGQSSARGAETNSNAHKHIGFAKWQVNYAIRSSAPVIQSPPATSSIASGRRLICQLCKPATSPVLGPVVFEEGYGSEIGDYCRGVRRELYLMRYASSAYKVLDARTEQFIDTHFHTDSFSYSH